MLVHLLNIFFLAPTAFFLLHENILIIIDFQFFIKDYDSMFSSLRQRRFSYCMKILYHLFTNCQ